MKTSRDVIVIAGLEGSQGRIRQLIQELPPDFPASILVILQEPARALELGSNLAADGTFPFLHAHEGQRIRRGYVYLGSSYAGIVVRSWQKLGLEPALANDSHHFGIRRCFNSVASVWGDRVIGILIGQRNQQAVDSLAIIKSNGGITIVQTTSEMIPCDTPDSRMECDRTYHEVHMRDMAAFLMILVGMSAPVVLNRVAKPYEQSDDAWPMKLRFNGF